MKSRFTIRFFFFKQKTAYEIMPSLVGSEMCIRDSLIYVYVRRHLRMSPIVDRLRVRTATTIRGRQLRAGGFRLDNDRPRGSVVGSELAPEQARPQVHQDRDIDGAQPDEDPDRDLRRVAASVEDGLHCLLYTSPSPRD